LFIFADGGVRRPSASPIRSGARSPLSRGLRGQTGAAAIEAALLFVIFFTLFYAIVSYSLPLLMMHAFQHAASEGARSAVAVDPAEFKDTEAYQAKVISRAQEIVGKSLDWLPQAEYINVQVVPTDGILTVTVQFDYKTHPLIPKLGIVPLPEELIGRAEVQL
jgi:Flp pilus assembly protein TadG